MISRQSLGGSLARCQRDILKSDPACCDGLSIIMPGNLNLPELLHPTLYNWFGNNVYATFTHRSEEVGGLINPNCELAALFDRDRCPYAGDSFDGRSIDAAVHDSPRSMVPGAEIEMGSDPSAADLIENQAMIYEPGSRGRQIGKRGEVH